MRRREIFYFFIFSTIASMTHAVGITGPQSSAEPTQIPSTQYVANFFRTRCDNPDIQFNKVGKYLIPSQKYVLSAIDRINGDTVYGNGARGGNMITMEYLESVAGLLNQSANCCWVSWANKDNITYATESVTNVDIAIDDTFLRGPVLWTSVASGKINGQMVYAAVSTGYDSNSYFGGNIAGYSTDNGKTWTETTLPDNAFWRAVAYGNNMFVAVADDSGSSTYNAAYSTDGKTWVGTTLPRRVNWQSVVWGGDKFVAVAADINYVAYSTDGKTWSTTKGQSSGLFTTQNWISITYGKVSTGALFVAVASSYNKAAWSKDGLNWSEASFPSKATYNLAGVAWGQPSDSTNGRFVTIPSDGSDTVLYSTGGTSWATKSGGWANVSGNLRSVSYDGTQWVAATENSGEAVYSTTGKTWTKKSIPDKQWRGLTCNEEACVAVGYGSNIAAYSINNGDCGISDLGTEDVGSTVSAVAYGNGVFVALATGHNAISYTGDPTNVGAYSSDGQTWYPMVLPASSYWQSITFDPIQKRFVAIGGGYYGYYEITDVAAYSTDGKNWTLATLPRELNTWQSVACESGTCVAITGGVDSANTVAYSTDAGTTWTEVTSLLPSEYWQSVAYGAGKFIIIGWTDMVLYSADGIKWTKKESVLPSDYWQSVVWGDNKFVVVAYDSTAVATSTDGLTWTSFADKMASEPWSAITYGDGVYFAVAGDHGYGDAASGVFAYSADGVNWKTASIPFDGYWHSVAYGDGKFIAVDYDSRNIITGTIASGTGTKTLWAVGQNCVPSNVNSVDEICETVYIGGYAVCTNAKCSCARTHLLVDGVLTKNNGLLTASGRSFDDDIACNAKCATVCADNAANNTDGIQKQLICGK